MGNGSSAAGYLRAAADFLRPEHRWIKRDMRRTRNGDVMVCAVGAINEVTPKTKSRTMRNQLIRYLYGQLPPTYQMVDRSAAFTQVSLMYMRSSIMSFNDRRRTRKTHVLALFDRAAEDAELADAITTLPKARLLKASNLGLDVPAKVKR